ncbi:DUF294 nucleotidyltransferase-like domain-containing protein [Psychrobacter piechaudii]|uniref:Putative nucleotidyltransferase substrate binding domain protein n=1 Tax=Psychrobacter piechaudii TaxID=1945521 RepID=A0A1R4GQ56_9GAMM|nr:DUF294 nucleotidyltransferase-like domain-containing protein [Psychrobacter piechaudii]SJM70370.1 Putative nucleotidyltransferase substrate binding domain protein [Psychrobacter piechaudii]
MTRLDFTQPPFDVLSSSERESIKKQTQIRYLAKNEALTAEDHNYFYVVLKGRIQQTLNGEELHDFAATNFSNDWFDARKQPTNEFNSISSIDQINSEAAATLSLHQPHNAYQYQYHAVEDSLLLQVNSEAIDKLSVQNRHIRKLLSGELAERMQAYSERSQSSTAAQHLNYSLNQSIVGNQAESQQLMLQPVTAIRMLEVHTISETATLFEAAMTMTKAGLKHVLVKRTPTIERHPTRSHQSNLGILTDADICRAVSEQVDMSTALCRDYAKFKLHTISHQQDISEALLTMIRYRVHRLPVLDENEEVIGVLGQSDLLAFLSHHSQLLSLQIEQANSIEGLKQPVESIGQYIRTQHNNGIKIGVISRIVQALNAHVFAKLWRLIVPDMVYENTCIIVMGSEGRGEQIMRTDQDNALIIRNGFSDPNLADYAETFNQTLADMGYPLCEGNIMMTNPLWRQPLNRFKSEVSTWFSQKEPEHAIWLSSLLDASYVCGDERLLEGLRKHLQIAHRSADPMFVRSFAQAALQFGEINQWWKKFVPLIGKPMPQDIDLKKAGIFPLVHGIRALALENDIFEATSTKDRLQQLAQLGVITPKRAETLNEALEFFMARRLDIALATDNKLAREVDPAMLSALERDLLKECLNVVKSFKNELRQRYQLDIA